MNLSIVHVTPQMDIGGAETMVVDLARGMAEQGHQVHVVARRGPLVKQLPSEVAFVPVQHQNKLAVLLNFTTALRNLTSQRRIDVINAHSPVTALAARLAAPGIPVVCTIHGLSDRGYRIAKYLLPLSANLVCPVSRQTAASLDLRERNIEVIWTGIRPAGSATLEREQLGLPVDAVVLGSVARLSPEKGPDNLVRIFGAVANEVPNAVLVMVGDGNEREHVLRLAQELGVADRVYLLGAREDVPAILPQFDAFLLPSRREGIPRATLEALFAGVPVIATNVGGLSEVAEVSRNLRLMDSVDPQAWVGAVTEALSRQRAEESGLLNRFGYLRMVDAYLEAYNRVRNERAT